MDPVVLQDLGGFGVILHQEIGLVGTEESVNPAHGIGGLHHQPHHFGAVEVAQNAVNEILIAVEQHRRAGRLGGLLDRLPLAQQGLEIVDQLLFADALGFGAHQQARARWLDQHPEGPQTVAFVLAVDPARDAHPLAVGLEHQEAAG